MQSLAERYGGLADFRIVYISEAHATDEWPISSGRCNGGRGPVCVAQPRTTEDRIRLAERFARDFCVDPATLPILVDPLHLGQPFDAELAPWPIRFYVLHQATARLLYCSVPKQASFDLGELRAILRAEEGEGAAEREGAVVVEL